MGRYQIHVPKYPLKALAGGAFVGLAATVAAVSTVAADLKVNTKLVAQSDGVSAVTADLKVNTKLAAQSDAVSSVTATFTGGLILIGATATVSTDPITASVSVIKPCATVAADRPCATIVVNA